MALALAVQIGPQITGVPKGFPEVNSTGGLDRPENRDKAMETA
jgi:hypothetical protein